MSSSRPSTRRRPAFTLIELLVVIAIIALLIAILLPALAETRRAGQNAVSLSNLRQLTTAIAAYGSENKDALVNPFDSRMSTLYGGGNLWCYIITRRSQNAGAGGAIWSWRFDDAGYASEMFAAHWASLLMDYIAPGQLRSRVQFAPGDKTVLTRFASYGTTDLDNIIWDGSYLYSPTMWLSPDRFKNATTSALNSDDASGRANWRRNRYDDVVSPQAKVMLWERFDFGQLTRKRGTGAGREKLYPQWNNPEAKPRFGRTDGSVDSVSIRGLNTVANDPDAAVRAVYTPAGGLWRMPNTVLGRYSMAEDGFENGQSGTGNYPAYFWSTRDGIRGRDIVR